MPLKDTWDASSSKVVVHSIKGIKVTGISRAFNIIYKKIQKI
jgi:hypothetical protein